jgi:3-hydroxybutyryl-CoA dehydrogenase
LTLDQRAAVGVLGAGTMGAGIAQVAAAAGHSVTVVDANAEAVERARTLLSGSLAREVEKGRLERGAARGLEERIDWSPGGTSDLVAFARCDLVIEAIVEDLGAKREAFRRLEAVVSAECVLGTNTSSLAVTAIAAACRKADRVIGIHFFNPAPVLPLVEVIPGLATAPAVTQATKRLVERWGKTAVLATDTPGFIVNRIARPFYGEALRLFEEGVADKATIDWALRELCGFRMGPFELMDLIGNDVNYTATRSVFEAMGYDPRYRPSVTQQRMVEAGMLGRKSGRGHYDYAEGAARPEPAQDLERARAIVDRILAMIINEAAEALYWRVATRDEIDLAMSKGVNYPRGPLRWADQIGLPIVLARLEQLQKEYGEDRYRPSALLRRMVAAGERFYP